MRVAPCCLEVNLIILSGLIGKFYLFNLFVFISIHFYFSWPWKAEKTISSGQIKMKPVEASLHLLKQNRVFLNQCVSVFSVMDQRLLLTMAVSFGCLTPAQRRATIAEQHSMLFVGDITVESAVRYFAISVHHI